MDGAVVEVDIFPCQPGQLAAPHSCIQQSHDDDLLQRGTARQHLEKCFYFFRVQAVYRAAARTFNRECLGIVVYAVLAFGILHYEPQKDGILLDSFSCNRAVIQFNMKQLFGLTFESCCNFLCCF